MDEDPANVAENWTSYFDDENQCNYYYNSVTQESAWSRPACMGFGKTSKQNIEKENSSMLLAAAFGTEENEPENEDNNIPILSPAPPTRPSPKKQVQDEVDNSFDSNDEFFAQLEDEVDAEKKNPTAHEERARRTKADEEAKIERQAQLTKLVAEEKAAAEAAAATATEEEANKKIKIEQEQEQEPKEQADKEAKVKRQAELEKLVAEKKKSDEDLKAKAAQEEAEYVAKKIAKEKKQAELAQFMAEKKIATEAKQQAEEEAERVQTLQKAEAAKQRKAELVRMASDVDTAGVDEIVEEEDVIEYSISISKDKDDSPPEIIDDEPQVKVIREQVDPVLISATVGSGEVIDTVEMNQAATKLQALQRSKVAKRKVSVMKQDTKKKRYDEFMAKQEEKEHAEIKSTVQQSVDANNKKDDAITKVQALQRQRSTQKKVAVNKSEKNAAAVKLQSLQRRRASKQQVASLKKEQTKMNDHKVTPDGTTEKKDENVNTPTSIPTMNDSDVSGQSSAASLHGQPNSLLSAPAKSIEITEITSTSIPAVVPEQSKQYIGYKKEEVTKPKPKPTPKPIISKKVPRNTPQKAIAEAAKFLEAAEQQSPPNNKPSVPETRSDELKLPEIVTEKSHIEPTNRRKNRGNDLNHVNKRTMASLEKLDTVAKSSAPPTLESKSAPPNGRLPKIGIARVSETERRKKKEPLFMRLEAQGRARSLALEKEKIENYKKIKESKKDAKPSKEAIMEHMQKYVEQRKAHQDKEKEYAHAKKKEWNDQAKLLKQKNQSPPRRKKLFDGNDTPSPTAAQQAGNQQPRPPSARKNKQQPRPKREPNKSALPKTKLTPRKIKKKLVKVKKLDFIEEEQERKLKEEQAKKDRLAKGKMYGKLAPAKHAHNPSPPRKRLNLIDDVTPIAQHRSPEGLVALSIIPSPRSPRTPHTPHTPRGGGGGGGGGGGAVGRLVKQISDDVDPEEHRDVIRSPREIRKNSKNPNSDTLSPVLSIPKQKKRSPIVSRLSSLEDSNNSVPNINAPYDGIVGSEWVAQVMEMDVEEATLADVYESGFEMFMIEKGIIQDES